ncbi:ABC-type sugar transport system substrate-binding protein [Kribbella sp. VKM Ac-2527]|uniref:ABC-type sugar transport system substrate-binding protein n=1 Tax=Kribbella caucasensis TaxID=2512215 RepID=A0A4V3CAP5_9ACTN|nr:substrate-binding domain-containing protein [Kribbella sp. VKM Ac-2527]TDO51652.1 ABC-type sugar transport system substrate-binding protein [Kribbella sp. VKM Ac-2527]
MATGTRVALRFPRTGAKLKLVAITAAAAALLAACAPDTGASGNSANGSSARASRAPVSEAAVKKIINRSFLKDIPLQQLNPAIQETMQVAAAEWTPAMEAKLQECLKQNVCETGRGSLTIAFPNDNINPWRQTFRAEITAQAIASPDVAKIIYSLGTDTASWLANFKSLAAQRPDVIVIDSIFGSAIAPAVRQAKAAGIVVVQAETPLPPEVASLVDVQATSDLCAAYRDGAKLVTGLIPEPAGYGLYTGIPGNASAAAWQPCLVKGLESAGWKKVIEGFTQWTPQGMTQEGNALFASGTKPAVVAYDYTMEYFAAPFLKAGQTPPVMISDVVNYSYLKQLKETQAKGIKAKAIVANSRVWYGRIGLTAGIMKAQGQQVDHQIDIPYPMVDADEILPSYDPAMPANAPVPTLFNADQETAVLAAGS